MYAEALKSEEGEHLKFLHRIEFSLQVRIEILWEKRK